MLNVTQTSTATREAGYYVSTEQRLLRSSNLAEVSTVAPAETQDNRLHKEYVAKQVEELNRFVRARNAQIQFEIDDSSARLVTKIVDISTREVLRQIPSEEILRMAEALSESSAPNSDFGMKLVQAKA